eukprot:59421-Amphidinium_carterae.1
MPPGVDEVKPPIEDPAVEPWLPNPVSSVALGGLGRSVEALLNSALELHVSSSNETCFLTRFILG